MEKVNYAERVPFEVSVPLHVIDDSTSKRNLKSKGWLDCVVFGFPEYDRIVLLLEDSTIRYLIGKELAVITDLLNYKGFDNVLLIAGLFEEDTPHVYGRELVLSFASKEQRMHFITGFKGKLGFVNYLSDRALRSSKPNDIHCAALCSYFNALQVQSKRNKLGNTYLLSKMSRMNKLFDKKDDSYLHGASRNHSNDTFDSQDSKEEEEILEQVHQLSNIDTSLKPMFVQVHCDIITPYMKQTSPGLQTKSAWLDCVLFGYNLTDRLILYYNTRGKTANIEGSIESGIIWNLLCIDELLQVQPLVHADSQERVLELSHIILEHEQALVQVTIAFQSAQQMEQFTQSFNVVNKLLSQQSTGGIDVNTKLALYSAKIEEERLVGQLFGQYLQSTVPQLTQHAIPAPPVIPPVQPPIEQTHYIPKVAKDFVFSFFSSQQVPHEREGSVDEEKEEEPPLDVEQVPAKRKIPLKETTIKAMYAARVAQDTTYRPAILNQSFGDDSIDGSGVTGSASGNNIEAFEGPFRIHVGASIKSIYNKKGNITKPRKRGGPWNEGEMFLYPRHRKILIVHEGKRWLFTKSKVHEFGCLDGFTVNSIGNLGTDWVLQLQGLHSLQSNSDEIAPCSLILYIQTDAECQGIRTTFQQWCNTSHRSTSVSQETSPHETAQQSDKDNFMCHECDRQYGLEQCVISYLIAQGTQGTITCPAGHTTSTW